MTLFGTATRRIYCRDSWDAQVILPVGTPVMVTEGRRGYRIRPVNQAGVRSVSTYDWNQLVARVEAL